MLVLYVISCLFYEVMSHGQMVDPPARCYLGKAYPNQGFKADNYYYGYNCGGRYVHQVICHGKCGVCGDRCNDPNPPNEAGGIYATGFIARTYQMGQVVNIAVQVTANHPNSYFEFRICPNNDISRRVTMECLDKHVLQLADGSGTRYYLPQNRVGKYIVPVKLPTGLLCSQCVIQWKMRNGNDWHTDAEHPAGCTGCGPQEEFYGCADVAIKSDSDSYHVFG